MKSFLVSFVGSRGNDSTIVISISKIKNRRAIRKNWKEKGDRDGENLSNPHSNLTHLFISLLSFLETMVIRNTIVDKMAVMIKVVTNSFIFLFGSV